MLTTTAIALVYFVFVTAVYFCIIAVIVKDGRTNTTPTKRKYNSIIFFAVTVFYIVSMISSTLTF